MEIKLRTNVKLNLGLSVLRKRPDGFHDIETLFVPCDAFGDELTVRFRNTAGRTPRPAATESVPDLLTVPGATWPMEKDLVYKAIQLLRADFNFPPLEVELIKHAPVGAGLGGGSADAAFALKAVNELCSLGLSEQQLASYAARLGADCAFFIYNRPMFGEGKGDILADRPIDLSPYRIEIEVPENIQVNTATAYSGVTPRETANPAMTPHEARPAAIPLRDALALPIEKWRETLVNDFEPSVFARFPELSAIKQSFYDRGAIYAAMSGSGSAIFGIFEK